MIKINSTEYGTHEMRYLVPTSEYLMQFVKYFTSASTAATSIRRYFNFARIGSGNKVLRKKAAAGA